MPQQKITMVIEKLVNNTLILPTYMEQYIMYGRHSIIKCLKRVGKGFKKERVVNKME